MGQTSIGDEGGGAAVADAGRGGCATRSARARPLAARREQPYSRSAPAARGGRPGALGRARAGGVFAVGQAVAVGLIAVGLAACGSSGSSASSPAGSAPASGSASAGDPAPSVGPASSAKPSGVVADGPLDLGCTVSGTSAVVTLWNPGGSDQPVAAMAVNFNSGGTLIAENQFNVTVNVAAGTARTVTVPAPAGSTTCGFAWWNP